MAVKEFKPYSPGRRTMSVASFSEITTDRPERSLVEPLKTDCREKSTGKNDRSSSWRRT